MTARWPRTLGAPAAAGALALALRVAWGPGFANYDALYSLVWGRQLGHGHSPSFDVSLAPTPHPLADLAGLALSPLAPRTAEAVLVVVAFLALGAVGWLVFRLGQHWFGTAAGVLAAVILLTREPVLSYGTRAYVDVPYLAFVLGAVLLVARGESRRPLVALALAGLIRPEAWLFSAALAAWCVRRDGWRWDLAALAAAAPVLWLGSDLALTGDALHSLTGTRENVRTLGRVTGLEHVPVTLPRRVGEILREPVLVAAAGGLALAWAHARERVRLLVAAGALALAAFCVLAAAGLPIITRYAFVLAALGAVLAGAGALGWTQLERTDPWRRRWMAFGALSALLLLAFVPAQARRLRDTRRAIAAQQRIQGDLWTLRVPARCPRTIGVVNHRLVPVLALHTGLDPARIVPAPLPAAFRGPYVTPATPAVAKAFVLDPRDPSQRVAAPPAGFAPAGGNRSWRVLERCPQDVRMGGGE